MRISTPDLHLLFDKTNEYAGFLVGFRDAIDRDELYINSQSFDEFYKDVCHIAEGLANELSARRTASIKAVQEEPEELIRRIVREELDVIRLERGAR